MKNSLEGIFEFHGLRDVLRDQMGFNGVVLTDDLDMGAIKKRYDIKTVISPKLITVFF